ncbi:hypothetical protein EK21DRAFT_112820 [Setomelanomma holmii]|uniref:F-box domain-containing protein n=1 Tax=Setomelanomma holmii TaxID=210430 RepID=A0A9P4LLV8_9PLEO|nr:hypothetical protein EK21DRAFT_112820 [Setomelanomma holmii]
MTTEGKRVMRPSNKRLRPLLPRVDDTCISKRVKLSPNDHQDKSPKRGTRIASALLALPSELRNYIYEIMLADPIESYSLSHQPGYKRAFVERHPYRPYLALAQVSRQLRSEFRPLYVSRPTIPFVEVQNTWMHFHSMIGNTPVEPGFNILPLIILTDCWRDLPFAIKYPKEHSRQWRTFELLKLTYDLIAEFEHSPFNDLREGMFVAIHLGRKGSGQSRAVTVVTVTMFSGTAGDYDGAKIWRAMTKMLEACSRGQSPGVEVV